MAITLKRIDPIIGSAFGVTLKAVFTITLPAAGTHYTTGGELLDFSSIPGTSNAPVMELIEGNTEGYTFSFVSGSDLTDSLLRIYSAKDTELTDADYPASLQSGVFVIEAQFTKY